MRIGLVAGEASGDLLGAGLIQALKSRHPGAVFEGVAGPHMQAAGCEAWAQADELAVMGLVEPLRHVPRLLRLRRSLIERWAASPPDVFVGIDAPDFNLALEQRLKSVGIPTIHYVSPTVWAWRSGRVTKIARAADRVLCLLPFEPGYYEGSGTQAIFVGHPKADELAPPDDIAACRRALGLDVGAATIALLPGSRRGEVQRLIDVIAGAAARVLEKRPDVRFVLPVAGPHLRPTIDEAIHRAGIGPAITLIDGQSIEAMSAADLVLLASGTAVLEAALLGRPCVAVYKLAPLSAAIVRAFNLLKLDYVTLPNNLTPEPLIPEFLQEKATPDAVGAEVLEMLGDTARRQAIEAGFATLRHELAQSASERAADAVESLINPNV